MEGQALILGQGPSQVMCMCCLAKADPPHLADLILPYPPIPQVVGKVRSGTGYMLMGKLQPYDPVAMAAAAAMELPLQVWGMGCE